MTELEFCEEHCGPLTDHQKTMLDYHVKNRNFVGVGVAIGVAGLKPLIQRGTSRVCVIDDMGYEQFASVEKRKGYTG